MRAHHALLPFVLSACGVTPATSASSAGSLALEQGGATWHTLAPMNEARSFSAAAVLSDDRVLVAGGSGANGDLASAEIYDATMNTWTKTTSMSCARSGTAAVVLADGRVVVAGSDGNCPLEVYDPTTATWTKAPEPGAWNVQPGMVVLDDGTVLVDWALTKLGCGFSMGLYDPATNAWSYAPGQCEGAQGIAKLDDGSVLVNGGATLYGDGSKPTATASLYNAAASSVKSAHAMLKAQFGQADTLFGNGDVLAVGVDVETYDPTTNAWTGVTPKSFGGRAGQVQAVDGTSVVIAGGLLAAAPGCSPYGQSCGNPTKSTLYYSDTSGFTTGPDMLEFQSSAAGAVTSGELIVAGGLDNTGTPTTVVEALY
jgi:hypothetical protein